MVKYQLIYCENVLPPVLIKKNTASSLRACQSFGSLALNLTSSFKFRHFNCSVIILDFLLCLHMVIYMHCEFSSVS